MLPYFGVFFAAAYLCLKPFRLDERANKVAWILVILVGTLFIGLRHEVGGDWLNYLQGVNDKSELPFWNWFSFTRGDPGYTLIAYLGSRFGMSIYGVNLICGFLVMSCLAHFARQQPYPWITILVAIPFFIIGINMGTVRQGLAVSLGLVALTKLNQSSLKFCLYVSLAFLVHKSAIILLLLPFVKNISAKSILILAIIIIILYIILRSNYAIETLVLSYLIDPDYQSSGALIRILVSLIPTVLMFIFWKDFSERYEDAWIFFWIGVGTIILFLLSPSLSTFADRMGYYTFPMQLAVWPRIIDIQNNRLMKESIYIGVILLYLAMLFIWLNFANHSWAWVPYQVIWWGDYTTNPQTICLTGFCR